MQKKKPRREEASQSSSSQPVPIPESAAGEDRPSKRTRTEDDEDESGKKRASIVERTLSLTQDTKTVDSTMKDISGVDVVEVYSPPRMTGLSPGFSTDITTCDDNDVA